MPGKFEIKKARNGQFHFNLKAANGEIILSSERYTTKRSAKKGIASVQKNSADDNRFDRRTARNGKPYFVLKAANQKVIGKSEMYETNRAMENGIRSVKRNGSTEKVDDIS
ncbi:MAG: YegP family protein [Verrucomicrobiales bacterium]|nr:YegP family protein [Verrucomicrobiales bacterium]